MPDQLVPEAQVYADTRR